MTSKARINATLALLQPQGEGVVNRHLLPHDQRQQNARREFDAWREAHPDFSSKELLDEWARIRRDWGLGQSSRKPR